MVLQDLPLRPAAALAAGTLLTSASLAFAGTRVASDDGRPVLPPRPSGAARDGRLVVQVAAPADGRRFGTVLFERDDVPIHPAGTVTHCFAFGLVTELARTPLDHFAMTCRPRRAASLDANAAVYDPPRRLTPARYRRLRAAGRRLPGVTLVAGRAGAGVRRVEVRGAGRTHVIRPRRAGGGFVVAYAGWLEDTVITVRAGRSTHRHRFGRAAIERVPGGGGAEGVLPPPVTSTGG